MDENTYIAVRYKKVKKDDGAFLFEFKDLIRKYYVNESNQIIYYKKGEEKTLDYIFDPSFLENDEEVYGYGEVFTMEQLAELYDTKDPDEIVALFTGECKRFIKLALFDYEKHIIKGASFSFDSLYEAEAGEDIFKKLVLDVESFGQEFLLDKNAIDILINYIENNKTETAVKALKQIKEIIEQYGDTMPYNQYISTSINDNTTPQVNTDIDISSLVGLSDVKEYVRRLEKNLKFDEKVKELKEKENVELPEPETLNLNMVFTGNPGTGKTTIARAIAGLLYKYGYIKNNNVIEASAKDFIGDYLGQTAGKTADLINAHRGSAILIDEAYSILSVGDGTQSYANDFFGELVKEMEKNETVFIFAGYKEEMKNFIDFNSGFKSRIGKTIDFKNYTLDELMEMFNKKIEKSHYKISDEALDKVYNIIASHIEDEKFGNGRFIDRLYEKIVFQHKSNKCETEDIEEFITIDLIDLKGIDVELNEEVKEKKMGFVAQKTLTFNKTN